jgi:hypothetical protein
VPSRNRKGIKRDISKKAKRNLPQGAQSGLFANKIGLKPPEPQAKFLIKLNEASVPTRYPETLEVLKKDFTQEIVESILSKSKEVLEWIKNQR